MTVEQHSAQWVLSLLLVMLVMIPAHATAQWLAIEVPERPSADSASVAAGRETYQGNCWFCHGEDGDGEGPVAEYLWPRPRDFTVASFKLRTTESGELPTDEDLYRTISLGIAGTAMTAWQSRLSEQERWQVIAYIKSFAADLFEDEAFDPYEFIVEPPEPPDGGRDELIAEGREVFEEADCFECHGTEGRGNGERAGELTDDWDFAIWPANLHSQWRFKGGSSPREVYMRLSTGLDGTPMPSYSETLTGEERWKVAYYVASLRNEAQDENSAGVVIAARRVDGDLPSSPDDPAWATTSAVSIPLTGQATFAPRWQIPAVTDLSVRALYNASDIALQLVWADRFADTLPADSAVAQAEGWEADDTYPTLFPDTRRVRGEYPDAAEVMFPARYTGTPQLPHFVYGNVGQPVDLWRWNAALQHASGSGSPVLELRGSGAQRPPEAQAPESQQATGAGVWNDGQWSVVIRRPLATEQAAGEVQLSAGTLMPISFHIWEGRNGETGLRMAVSSWYFLSLEKAAPVVSYFIVLLAVLEVAGMEFVLVLWVRRRAARGRLTEYGVTVDS